MNHNRCLICQSDKIKPLEKFQKSHLAKCSSCSLVFASKIPTLIELEEHYKGYGRNDYLSPITIKRYNEILDLFEKFRITNNLIDVGCGIGLFAEVAIKRGWNVYGTEFTDEAINICSKKGINMQKGVLNKDNYSPHFFDIVCSFEVIEHINTPLEEIVNFNAILRRGGVLYLTTPNFNSISKVLSGENWTIVCYPEHLTYYTPKTLDHLLKGMFKKQWITTTGFSVTRNKMASGKANINKPIYENSDDEILRTKMEEIWYWAIIKKVANLVLNLFKKGDAIKAFYIKK